MPVNLPRRLSDEVVQALLGYDAGAGGVRVSAMAGAWRGAIDSHTKPHRLALGSGAEYQEQIPRLEPEHNGAVRLIERSFLLIDRPLARQSPLIHIELVGCLVVRRLIGRHARRGAEVLRACITNIRFR